MDEFKAIAKLLAAIKAGEGKPVFCQSLVSEEALCMTEEQRDKAALLLQKNGYIEGLRIIDGIDGQRAPYIYWPGSNPAITLKGLEYMEERTPSATPAGGQSTVPGCLHIKHIGQKS